MFKYDMMLSMTTGLWYIDRVKKSLSKAQKYEQEKFTKTTKLYSKLIVNKQTYILLQRIKYSLRVFFIFFFLHVSCHSVRTVLNNDIS